MLYRYSKSPSVEWEGQTKFPGLHGAAFLGAMEIFAAVLEMKEWDINAGDCFGSTALSWTAARGHNVVVKMLLKRKDVNPEQANTKYCSTPLSQAARWGNKVVVKMLLEREEVNPDHVDTTLVGGTERACGGTKISSGTKGCQPRPGGHQIWPKATFVGSAVWA